MKTQVCNTSGMKISYLTLISALTVSCGSGNQDSVDTESTTTPSPTIEFPSPITQPIARPITQPISLPSLEGNDPKTNEELELAKVTDVFETAPGSDQVLIEMTNFGSSMPEYHEASQWPVDTLLDSNSEEGTLVTLSDENPILTEGSFEQDLNESQQDAVLSDNPQTDTRDTFHLEDEADFIEEINDGQDLVTEDSNDMTSVEYEQNPLESSEPADFSVEVVKVRGECLGKNQVEMLWSMDHKAALTHARKLNCKNDSFEFTLNFTKNSRKSFIYRIIF